MTREYKQSNNLKTYLARAEEARADGDAATLDNVRERFRCAEAAWRGMAVRAERTEARAHAQAEDQPATE